MNLSNPCRRPGAPVQERLRPGSRTPARRLARRLLAGALGLFAATALFSAGGLAKATIAGAPLLEDGQRAPLSGLQYGATFSAEVQSIRLALDEEQGDKVTGAWVLIASNTSGNPHLVDISVRLVDDEGKRLASSRKKAMLQPSTEEQTVEIRFKIPRNDWDRAHHLQIQADFRIH